jgi:hypothetical protein
MQIIIAAVITVAVLLFFRETRNNVILRQRANRLNKWYEELEAAGCSGLKFPQPQGGKEGLGTDTLRVRWKIAADEERAGVGEMLRISLTRPFLLLTTEPVVFFFSLWAAFSWSVLYINLSVIPLVFQLNYNFSLSQANSVFTATCIGTLLAMTISIIQEKMAIRRRKQWNSVPEHRLYFSCLESTLLPLGLFLFGWTSQFQVHWIVPVIGVAISTIGIFSVYLAVFNYLADTYHSYASSALAAQSFCRNMLGGIFPLVSKQLFEHLSFGPAASLLGGIGTALTLVPWLLVFFGPQIRARSRVARQ